MKAHEVLSVLRVSRGTLSNYVKQGIIKTRPMPHNRYEYDNDSVYDLIAGGRRKTLIYARVSTVKQKPDLQNQVELLKKYCFAKGLNIDGVYQDVASGISFSKRKDFFKLLDLVMENKVERIVITYKDRMIRVGFDLFDHLFKKYGCTIEVVKLYSKRKNIYIKKITQK